MFVYHEDKDAFLKGNIEPDPDEIDMVFDNSPSYAELLQQVRKELNWMDPSDIVELEGRHNVGFGMHIRWKIMRVNSEQRWVAYKETVAESLDKALELFATKKVDSSLHLDLNRNPSPLVASSPPPLKRDEIVEPLLTQEVRPTLSPFTNNQDEALQEDNDEYADDDNEVDLHDNNVGDLDKYHLQETMDHSIPFSRAYASDSDDDGPDEQVDAEGFTVKEAEAFEKVFGRDHRTTLFKDVSLADEAVVDGGQCVPLGVRPSSHRDLVDDKNWIATGSKFDTLLELKMWLDNYSVTHYRPHKVVHSDVNVRYTVACACEDKKEVQLGLTRGRGGGRARGKEVQQGVARRRGGCPWIVRARPWKGGGAL